MAFLENAQDTLSFNFDQTNAEDFTARIPSVFGKKI
jgi:hypothetical protein